MAGIEGIQLVRQRDEAHRIVHVVRHGQYSIRTGEGANGVDGPLTARGREQARAAARYLAQWPIADAHCSDLERAIETAAILADQLGGIPVRQAAVLRELIPTSLPEAQILIHAEVTTNSKLDKIFERYFQPPQDSISHHLLVAHGNLIRAMVCRVLATELVSWLKMRSHHLSLTRFLVRADGSIQLLSFNDIGHLPPELIGEQ